MAAREPKAGGPDPEAVRAGSMAEVARRGGGTNPDLPTLAPRPARTGDALARRTLAMHALRRMAYGTPAPHVRAWIREQGLEGALSPREAALLAKPNEALTAQEANAAGWRIEAVFALLWAGGLVESLALDAAITREGLASLPSVAAGEDARPFVAAVRLRPHAELFAALDLYYRAHWAARDARLEGRGLEGFDLDSIVERRHALAWLLDRRARWDEIPLDT